MPQAIILELPIPPSSLNPNARSYWRKRAEDAAKYRLDVSMMALNQRPSAPFTAARLGLRYFVMKEPDDDNLTCWFKAGRDGLYDAGYVTNDRRFVQMPPQWELVKHSKDRRLEVTVEEITE